MRDNFHNEVIAQKYHWAKQEELLLLKPYLSAIGKTKNKIILDIGCGSGWLTKIIAKNAKKVIAIDNSESVIKIAKNENQQTNIDYKVLDAEKIDKLEGNFDIIISALTLQLITPKEKLLNVLKKCHSKLNNDGNFVILIPHPCFINQNNRWYNQYIFEKDFNYFVDPQKYIVKLKSRKGNIEFESNFYNLETYSLLFNRAGFVIKEIVEPKVTKELIDKYQNMWNLELTKPFYIIINLLKTVSV